MTKAARSECSRVGVNTVKKYQKPHLAKFSS